jgi:glycosyltransferase involved in cell wall biosynthesis
MDKPLVSAIVPCYNAAPFLRETLDSILTQGEAVSEIIAVNDGSTDDTATILATYGDRLRTVHTENRGVSAARNLGTQLARGEFLQYVDADDVLLPGTVAARLAWMTDGVDVVYTGWQRWEKQADGSFQLGEAIDRAIAQVHPDPEIALFGDFWCPPAALLYRRAIVAKVGGWNQTLPVIQDARFLLDAALYGGRFDRLPGVGCRYRVHGQGLSSRRDRFVQDCWRNAQQVQQFWETHGGITPDRRQALLRAYGMPARYFYEHDRPRFQAVLQDIHTLTPHYIPVGPPALRRLSQVLGYERAEAWALRYRRLKQRLGWHR